MKYVAVTSCTTGIAHTYMAAEKLETTAEQLGHQIKVETQGAMGIENELMEEDILAADAVIFATDIPIERADRFAKLPRIEVPVQHVLKDAASVFHMPAK